MEPATFRLVAQCLNQVRYRVPLTKCKGDINETAEEKVTEDVTYATLSQHSAEAAKQNHEQEVLRTNSLLSYDTTRTA
jgi:hypothetical protein